MLRLGLTGGIGAGKSTAARRLAERGATVVDADRLAREVVEPGTAGLAEVVAAFGSAVLTADGALDRAALGRLVFSDDDARRRLNGLLHPRIAELTRERMAAAGPDAIVVHDVPLLVENGMGAAYHLVLVVHADAGERVRRLVADRGMAPDDARARVAAQADDAARRAAADVWLDNSGPAPALVAAVDRLWDERLAPFAENLRLGRPAPVTAHPDDAGLDDAALARLRRRLGHLLGETCRAVERAPAGSGTGGHDVVLVVPDATDTAAEGAVARRLAAAGFLPGADGAALRSADPGLGVVLHLRPEAPGARREPERE